MATAALPGYRGSLVLVTSKADTSSPVAQPSGIGRLRRVLYSLHSVSAADLIKNQWHILLLRLVHLGGQLLGQALVVHLHRVSIGSASTADGNIRQRFPRLVSFTRQSRNHARRSVILVQRRAQLLPRLRKLLLQRKRLEHNRIPLVLERAEQRRDRGEVRRAGRHYTRRLELDEVFDREVLAGDGVGVVFGDVRFDEPLFEDIAALARGDGRLRCFPGDCAQHGGGSGVGGLRRAAACRGWNFWRNGASASRFRLRSLTCGAIHRHPYGLQACSRFATICRHPYFIFTVRFDQRSHAKLTAS